MRVRVRVLVLAIVVVVAVACGETPAQQCSDFEHDFCNRAKTCGGDFANCIGVLEGALGPCSSVYEVDGRLDDCNADIAKEQCTDLKAGTLPNSCSAVTFRK